MERRGAQDGTTAGSWHGWSVGVIAVLAALNALIYCANWGGDPEIHMIFGRHLAAGMPLQFNAGEFSTGETSPAYMALVALFYLLVPPVGVVLCMKAVGVGSALGIAWLVREEGLRVLGDARAAWTISLSFLAMPLVWFQAWLGMENMLAALVLVPLMRQMLRQPAVAWSTSQLAAWSFGVGAATLLRPEAIFFCFALSLYLLLARRLVASLLVAAAASLVAFGLVLAIQECTRVPLHGAGLVRAALGRHTALQVPLLGHILHLHPKPLRIIVYVWPMVLVLISVFRESRFPRGGAGPLLLCGAALPLALQVLLVTPVTHSSRYLLPTYAVLWVVLPTLIVQARPGRWLPWAVLFGAALAFGAENLARYRAGMGGMTEWSNVTRDFDPDTVRSLSDHICSVTSCDDGPIAVAAREVQVRLLLDERFVVRSLDGIVDHHLKAYLRPWGVDHIGYIKGRDIRVLLDLPDYRTDSSHFGLSELRELEVGQTRHVEGLTFSRHLGHPRVPTIITVSPARLPLRE